MRVFITVAGLAALLASSTGCRGGGGPGSQVTAMEIDGAAFEVADAAVSSNCLSMTFAVRGFLPPPGVDPQTFFPPAKSIDIRLIAPGGELSARPLGGGGGGGGNEEDGRIWMEQGALYSLSGSVPEGEEVTVNLVVSLDDDFAAAEPLEFRVPVVAGPGGGTCP
jgi:hypothetical protein